MRSYVTLFLTTGALAVLFKLLGERSESRLAGLVATAPLKILIAWWVLGSVGGAAALRGSIPGMAIGLTAIVLLLVTGWVVSARVGVAWTIAAGSLVWLGASLAMHLATATDAGAPD